MGLEPEQVLGDLHPQLLPGLATSRLIGVVAGHVSVVDLQSFLDCLRVEVEDPVENDLGLLDLVDAVEVVLLVLLVVRFVLLRRQLFDLSLAHIDCVVYFEEDRLALLLVRLFPL